VNKDMEIMNWNCENNCIQPISPFSEAPCKMCALGIQESLEIKGNIDLEAEVTLSNFAV